MDRACRRPLDRSNHRPRHVHLRHVLHRPERAAVHPQHLPSLCSINLLRKQPLEELIRRSSDLVQPAHVRRHRNRRRCKYARWLHGDLQSTHGSAVEVGEDLEESE
jgi:hypothetical protein